MNLCSKLLDLDPGSRCPATVRMIVEIPKGSTNKYEYDAELGIFKLDRTLYSPVHYPGDYGFVPGTKGADGDPIDLLALVEQPSFPGCLIEVRPLGVLEMTDRGKTDQKILGVPTGNPRFDQIRAIHEVAPHIRKEFEHFFTIYKELEGKTVRMQGWKGLKAAHDAIRTSRKCYLSSTGQMDCGVTSKRRAGVHTGDRTHVTHLGKH